MLLILALQAPQQTLLESVCLKLPLLAAGFMILKLLLQLFHALAQCCHILLAPLKLVLQGFILIDFVLSIAGHERLQ